jgi:pyruvate/2-oxoglutarate dehydrogenase complex dihydrolipoamide dehydrogenase (E3) component
VYSAGTAQKLVNCFGYQVGKKAVILGSGDIGLIMARRMSLEGAKVEAVCEVMPYSGGLTRNIVQCLEDFGIPLYLSTTVVRIHGEKRLEGVTIAQVDEKRQPVAGTERYIPCDTLLLSVGLIPENELTRLAGIPIDPVTNGAIVDENCQTAVPGIFACGNVLQVHDLVDYVSEEAERAGKAAAKLTAVTSETALETKAGFGVRYVIPQVIRNREAGAELFLRVTAPFGKVRFLVTDGENVIHTAKRLKVAPGEMENVTLSANLLKDANDLTFKLEEK